MRRAPFVEPRVDAKLSAGGQIDVKLFVNVRVRAAPDSSRMHQRDVERSREDSLVFDGTLYV